MSIINSMDIFSELVLNAGYQSHTGRNVMLKEFAIINKALKTKIHQQHFTFDGTFASPFNTFTPMPKDNTSPRVQKQEPSKKLFLKGTLLKEDALAIIIDEDGKTYICKQGDRIDNQVIAAISEDMVTLKNGSATIVLKVKEP